MLDHFDAKLAFLFFLGLSLRRALSAFFLHLDLVVFLDGLSNLGKVLGLHLLSPLHDVWMQIEVGPDYFEPKGTHRC